jgi:hypothetical protein
MGAGGLAVDAMSIGCLGVDRRVEQSFILSHFFIELYYLVCVFDLYDQISFSFSPVFPQLIVPRGIRC